MKTIRVRRITPETVAKYFHETYEGLASNFGYKTCKETQVPFDELTSENKALMIAVAEHVLIYLGFQEDWSPRLDAHLRAVQDTEEE